MQKIVCLILIISSVSVFAFSCSNNKDWKGQGRPTQNAGPDTSFLNERNFIYRNLPGTANIVFITKPQEKGIDLSAEYTDSTLKKQYFKLSGDQTAVLIAPFLPKDYGSAYVKQEIWAWLVSKQQKIGDFQPIVVFEIGKADFEALELIVLDKYGKPINEFDLDEENPFPDHPGYPYNYHSYSLLNKNEIKSYRISESTDSAKRQVTIDSNVFKSIIGADGRIVTEQIVKSHLVKSL